MKRLLLAVVLVGCSRNTQVGSLLCKVSGDCAPPQAVCNADGRCVPGCIVNPQACVGGATCDERTGECTGGLTAGTCATDTDCDPPDLICRTSTSTCVAGCTVSNTCASGQVCDPSMGHCCAPGDPGCPTPPDAGPGCNTDSECVGAPMNICSGGACVPGCATGAPCAAPLTCDTTTGHCATPSCARDTDCDDGSYCTQAATCSVLAFGGKIACAGGTTVYYHCAVQTSPSQFESCAGMPGPVGCPYCIDYSCFHPGLCSSDNDCHRGDQCINGLCMVQAPACPSTVALTDVVAGKFAAGKEVCVRGQITSVSSGADGMTQIRLGSTPYLYVDVAPMYQAAGLVIPSPSPMVTVHGVVRWDGGHEDFELLPVDWIGP